MYEVGPQHPVTYRQEIVKPIFDCIAAADSCCVVGIASMGKSRLLQHLRRRNIQEQFLGADVAQYLFVLTDCNRAQHLSEWGLYELLLTSLIEACIDYSVSRDYYAQLNDWRMTVLAAKKDPAIALRQLELAIRLLIRKANIRLVIVFDSFDTFYRALPAQALANLRSFRDANKYRLSYILVLRYLAVQLRDPSDGEGFNELFSHSSIGLKPYSKDDAMRMIEQIRQRKNVEFTLELCDRVYELSGGCPGLMMALLDVAIEDDQALLDRKRQTQIISRKVLEEECQKLWVSMQEEEQCGVINIMSGNTVPVKIRMNLELKGVITVQGGTQTLFSPIFSDFVRKMKAC